MWCIGRSHKATGWDVYERDNYLFTVKWFATKRAALAHLSRMLEA